MADLPLKMKAPTHPKSKKLVKAFESAGENIVNQMFPMWLEMYGNSSIIDERCDTIQGVITALVDEMIREEQDNKAEYNMKYNALLVEANTLEQELSIVVTRTETVNEPLCVKICSLEKDLEDHRRVRSERLELLKELQNEEKELCTKLQQSSQYSHIITVPSQSTLSEIRHHNETLQTELKSRLTRYTTLRDQVMKLWSSLELKPTTSFEVKVHENSLENSLGTDNLEKLAALALHLEDTRSEMEKEMESLRYKLSTLWNRLNTDAREREAFLTTHDRLCVSSLSAWHREIAACTALKLKRIREIVGAIRAELSDWWDRAHVGRPQRELFTQFELEENITEEVLEAHEREVENVKQYYEENRDILDLLGKRFELWREMVELEDKANDKDRLFKNRGGQLLLEEKQRKFLQKELPKLEKRLEKLLDKFQARTGHVFLYDGQDARATIAAQWEERSCAKENLKNARKNVASSSSSQAAAAAQKSKLLGPNQTATRHTPGRNATLKRKGDATPALEVRRGRLLESATRTPNAQSRIIGSAARKPQVVGSSPASSVLSYSLFQRNITQRKFKRSSSLSKISHTDSSSLSISSVLRSSLSHESLPNNLLQDTPDKRVQDTPDKRVPETPPILMVNSVLVGSQNGTLPVNSVLVGSQNGTLPPRDLTTGRGRIFGPLIL